MAKQSITQLKNWFKTQAKPMQSQFWDWLDSFRHKDDKINVADLDNELRVLMQNLPSSPVLSEALTGKADLIDDLVDPNQLPIYDFATSVDLLTATAPNGKVVSIGGYTAVGDCVMPKYRYDSFSTLEPNGGTVIAPNNQEIGRWIAIVGDSVNPKIFGLQGVNAGSDVTAIQQSIDSLQANGGGIMTIPSGEFFTGRPDYYVQRGVRLRPNVSYVGNGMPILNLNNNAEFVYIGSETANQVHRIIDQDTTETQNYVHVTSVAGLEVGKVCFVRLGQSAYDVYEPDWFFFGTIKNINDGTKIVTFDRPLGYALTVANVYDTNQRKIVQLNDLIENVEVKNLYLRCDTSTGANAESGINIQYGRNLRIDNIKFFNPGSAALNIQYAENIQCNNLHIERSERIGGQGSKGRCLSLAESNNVRFENILAQEFEAEFATLEGKNLNVTFNNVVVYNTFSDVERPVFVLLGQGDIYVYNLMIGGYQMKLLEASYLFGKCIVENLTVLPGTFFRFQEQFGAFVKGSIQFGIGAGASIYERKTFSIKYPLDKNMFGYIAMPRGRYAAMKIIANNMTGFTELRIARDDSFQTNGGNIAAGMISNIAAETNFEVLINAPSSLANQLNYDDSKAMLIVCDGSAPKGSYFLMTIDYFAIPIDGGEEEVFLYKDYTQNSSYPTTASLVEQTAATTIITEAVGATDAFITVDCNLNISEITAGTIKTKVVYHDSRDTERTKYLYEMGATDATISATGDVVYPSIRIKAKAGSNVVVSTEVTGTITYDANVKLTRE